MTARVQLHDRRDDFVAARRLPLVLAPVGAQPAHVGDLFLAHRVAVVLELGGALVGGAAKEHPAVLEAVEGVDIPILVEGHREVRAGDDGAVLDDAVHLVEPRRAAVRQVAFARLMRVMDHPRRKAGDDAAVAHVLALDASLVAIAIRDVRAAQARGVVLMVHAEIPPPPHGAGVSQVEHRLAVRPPHRGGRAAVLVLVRHLALPAHPLQRVIEPHR